MLPDLKELVSNGTITEDEALYISMRKKEQYVRDHHPRKITFNEKEKRYRTYVYVDGKGRISVAKASMNEMIDWLYDFYSGQDETARLRKVSFHDCFEMAYDYKLNRRLIKKSTYDKVHNDYDRTFAKYPVNSTPVLTITKAQLRDYMHQIIAEIPMSKRAYGNLKSIVNTTFEYAYNQLGFDQVLDTKRIFESENLPNSLFVSSKKEDEEQIFTNAEIKALAKAAEENSNDVRYMGVMLAIYTGLRNGELTTLKSSDINLKTGELHIERAENRYKDEHGHSCYVVGSTKNEAAKATIVIPQIALSYVRKIETYNMAHGYHDWLLQDKKGRVHTYDMDKAIRRLCRLAGIPVRSMHKCRKTTASILIDDLKADESYVKYYMRHTLYETTQRCYHFSRMNKEGKQNKAQELDTVLRKIS